MDLENTCATTGSISSSAGPLIIGNLDAVTGSEFDGTIDDIGLWNDALTADEVENILGGNGPTNRKCKQWWLCFQSYSS